MRLGSNIKPIQLIIKFYKLLMHASRDVCHNHSSLKGYMYDFVLKKYRARQFNEIHEDK
jgi:hypothetical protein